MTMPPYITPQQAKWFASVQEGLEKDTGKALEQWVEIAKKCPETKQRARLNWLESEHGLGLNRASLVLGAAFETGLGWDNPQTLLDHVWKTPESRLVYDQIQTIVKDFGDDVVISPRKGFSAFSRRVQFAALRPTRAAIRLGLAVPLTKSLANKLANKLANNLVNTPKISKPISSDSWSDRLTSVCLIHSVDDIDEDIIALLHSAYMLSA